MLAVKFVLAFAAFALGQEGSAAQPPVAPNANISPPEGAFVVGAGAEYTTIQAAVDALTTNTTDEQAIFIYPGVYAEQVYISRLDGPLTVYGYTEDMTSYKGNQVSITAGESQETKANNDLTGTLRVHTENFKLYNVDVINSWGVGSQAIALSTYATVSTLPPPTKPPFLVNTPLTLLQNQGYYGIGIYGHQDTLLANVGNQTYSHSLITGATDFVFGLQASVWFEQCDIRVVEGGRWITASGRQSDDANWYLFNKCNIAAAEGQDVPDGSYYLGRPWRDHARVGFQFTEMSAVINPAGWIRWNEGDEVGNVTYAEFGNYGPGSEGERVDFATELEHPVEVATVLGEGYADAWYVDGRYLS